MDSDAAGWASPMTLLFVKNTMVLVERRANSQIVRLGTVDEPITPDDYRGHL
jgi:hypothetical protein